jgi:hypothetical protein
MPACVGPMNANKSVEDCARRRFRNPKTDQFGPLIDARNRVVSRYPVEK